MDNVVSILKNQPEPSLREYIDLEGATDEQITEAAKITVQEEIETMNQISDCPLDQLVMIDNLSRVYSLCSLICRIMLKEKGVHNDTAH